jgi:serine/threonine protein phosphatase PrpC
MGTGEHLPRALLLGSDHPDLGDVAVRSVGDRLAVGLTRGALAKAYSYVDPNEDVAAVVSGDDADLLVVADGHNGCAAAEVALEVVVGRLGDRPPPPELQDRALVELFWEANEAIRAATSSLDHPHAASRTTLTVVLAASEQVQWAAMGDSPVVVLGDGTQRELTRPRHQFLGDAVSIPELAGRMVWGTADLGPASWVLALTDGFSNFAAPAGHPERAAAAVLAGVDDATSAVRALVDAAAAGGAGDNVAVALRAPGR